MSPVALELQPDLHRDLWEHLLPHGWRHEEAAFLFATYSGGEPNHILLAAEWYGVPPSGFEWRSAYHFELTDAVRAHVIKRAHDLGACLVELHSHLGDEPASFSPSDRAGLAEFVPHVWWRLKGRPYGAVVVTRGGFDGLVWLSDPLTTERLPTIVVGSTVLRASCLSPLEFSHYDE